MDSRERVLGALNNKQLDRVPIIETMITELIIRAIAGRLGVDMSEPRNSTGLILGDESHELTDVYCPLIKELGWDAGNHDFATGLKPIDNRHGTSMDKSMY